MLAAIRNLSLIWRILSVVGIVGAAGGLLWASYAYIHHQGYVSGEADADARCARDKAAQRAANQAAIDAATRTLSRVSDQLDTRTQELDDAREALEQAAAADPLGTRECLGADSVRRLAPIR